MKTSPLEVTTAQHLLRTKLTLEGKSPNTVRAYSSDVQEFALARGLTVLDPTTYESEVRNYLEKLNASAPAATARRRLAALRTLARVIGVEGILVGYKMPTPGTPAPHPLPGGVADLRSMIEAAPTAEKRLLVGLCGFAGLRVSEARSLRPSHVRRDRMEIRVRGKGAKERWVPISPELLALIDAVPRPLQDDDRPYIGLRDRAARLAFTKIGHEVGVSRPVASHDARMTFGTAVFAATKDLRITQELLGHADPATTARYTGIDSAAKRSAVEGLWS